MLSTLYTTYLNRYHYLSSPDPENKDGGKLSIQIHKDIIMDNEVVLKALSFDSAGKKQEFEQEAANNDILRHKCPVNTLLCLAISTEI
jgi:hypothetical protein